MLNRIWNWVKFTLPLWMVIQGASTLEAQSAALRIQDVTVYPGQGDVSAAVLGLSSEPISGFQIALQVDPDRIQLQGFDENSGILDAVSVEFLDSFVDETEGEAGLIVILDGSAPFDGSLPATQETHLVSVLFDADQWLIPSNQELLSLAGEVGTANLQSTILVEGTPVTTDLQNGFLSVIEQNVLIAESTTGQAALGEVDHEIKIHAFNSEDLQGFSISLVYDPLIWEFSHVEISGTITETAGAEFVEDFSDDDQGNAVLGVLLDILPPYSGQVIPATGIELEVARFYFDVQPDVFESVETTIGFAPSPGTPVVDNVFVIGNQSVQPLTIDAVIEVAVQNIFLRGDADGDLYLDLSDVINNLVFMTGACPECPDPTCYKALDVNDNGIIDLADGVQLVNYLYTFGPPPAAPFPEPGPDPTPDDLTCDR
ncbi:MAG: hypothetical protein ACPHP7_04635 [Planctomycetota bacterium]